MKPIQYRYRESQDCKTPSFEKHRIYILQIAYDGNDYYGWQANNDLPTIEGTLKKVLAKIFQTEISLDAASRTDRGVHAEGQVASFSAPYFSKGIGQLQLSLNQLLPHDIRIHKVKEIFTPFSPSLDAKEKTYCYRIDTATFHDPFARRIAWHIPYLLNRTKMEEAASYLVGTHDFAGFTNEGAPNYEHTLRTLSSITFEETENFLTIFFTGNAFLYRMVRNIVGTLIEVGKGNMTPNEVQQILFHKDRKKAGVTAPAHGLVLKQIRY